MTEILSLGSINADFELRVERPPEGPGTLLTHDLLRTSGGKALTSPSSVARPVCIVVMPGGDKTIVLALNTNEAWSQDADRLGQEVADGTGLIQAPADVVVVDATGAGDAFAGALACALLRGHRPGEAASLAVAASACAVGTYGSQESYPSPEGLAAMRQRVANANQSKSGSTTAADRARRRPPAARRPHRRPHRRRRQHAGRPPGYGVA